jgi:alkylation response protein AidB-like acyl-CoA dehydrogenase
MGEHELGAADVDAAEYRAARATVWRALAGLGALRLAIPIVAGGEGAGLGCLIVVAELMGRHLY